MGTSPKATVEEIIEQLEARRALYAFVLRQEKRDRRARRKLDVSFFKSLVPPPSWDRCCSG